MLSLPNDGRYPAREPAPDQRRQKTLAALGVQSEALARSSPVLVILEDTQWGDPTSLEAFGRMVDRVRTLRVLLIVTFRPEFEAPWVGQPHVTALTINRLAERDIGTMIDRVVGNTLLPADIRMDIVERTDGIPLFVEEMTKAVLEAGGERGAMQTAAAIPSPARAVPASLYASLMARLDRLGPAAREVAQAGAAIGRRFSHELLLAAAQLNLVQAEGALDRLIAAGLVFKRGTPPSADYQFKHALVQDTAYGSLLRGPRQTLHARIATAMRERYTDVAERAPEVLAHHLTEAGQPDAAAAYWLEAGRRAAGRSANIEAVAHLTRGITGLNGLPDTRERRQQELTLQLALGPALMATGGFGEPRAVGTYERACHLAETLGEDRSRFAALWGSWLSAGQTDSVGVTSGRRDAMVHELFRVAQRLGDSGLLVQAHHAAWATVMWRGRLVESREHVRQGLLLYDRDLHRGHALVYGGHDPAVCGYGQGAITLWLLGYPDQAARSTRDGIDLARSLSHAPSLGHALWFAAVVYHMHRDVPKVLDCGERLIALGHEHGLPFYQTIGSIMHGWALVRLGRVTEGLPALRQAMSRYRTTAVVMISLLTTMLAEAEFGAGLEQEGMDHLEACDRDAVSLNQLFWRAGILHLKGERLAARHEDTAEACLRASLELARGQQAKSLELRAATGLARLFQQQGRRDEARDLLAPIYGWFTEGFDTLDLKQAKALLDELA